MQAITTNVFAGQDAFDVIGPFITPLITDQMNAEFMNALVAKGQRVQYVQIGGAQHAFFDWKPDAPTKATFYQFGVYYAAEMKAFFASVLRAKK